MFERCLYFNINALTRRVNKIWEQAFQEFSLSPSHAYLLRVVLTSPGISQQGIATELILEKSTVARFVEVLEKKGYLYRQKSGREQFVFPTKSALAINEKLEQQGKALYQQMIEQLGKSPLVDLVDELRATNTKLNK